MVKHNEVRKAAQEARKAEAKARQEAHAATRRAEVADKYTVHVSTFFDAPPQPVNFLVEGAIPRACITLLTGESGGGKSWAAYDLARAVSMGGKWLGKGVALPTPELVAILNYDNPTDTLKLRLIKLGFTPEANCYIHTQGMTKVVGTVNEMLRLPDQLARLNDVLLHLNPSLIIFDSLRQGHTLDENDNQQMGNLMAVFKKWREFPSKPAVVLIHHTPKSATGSQWTANARGSGEIIASSDVVLELIVKDKELFLKWTKSRPWEIGKVDEVKFEIVDKVKDLQDQKSELIEGQIVDVKSELFTYVNALSPLPGQPERVLRNKVIKTLSQMCLGSRTTVPLRELAKKMTIAESIVRTGLYDAKRLGFIREERTKSGRGYAPIVREVDLDQEAD